MFADSLLRSRARRARRRAASWCALGVIAVAVGPLAMAPAEARVDPDAAKKSKIDRQIEELKGDLDDLSVELQNAYNALRKTTAQVPAAQSALDQAVAAADAADRANAQAAADLALAKANEAKAEAALASTQKEISSARRAVAAFASQLYQQQGGGQLSVAMDATSPEDFADRLAMVSTVMSIHQRSIGTLSTAQADQTAQEAHLSALRVDSTAAKVKAEQALARANAARDAATAAKVALDNLVAQQQAAASGLEAEKSKEQATLASMQAESSRLKAVLAERARLARIAAAKAAAAKAAAEKAKNAGKKPPAGTSGTSAPRGSGGFLSAAELSQPITSEYGMRFHPIRHEWRMHTGIDFGGPCGTPIYAAGPGEVISAGWAGGYGNRVVIDHGIVNGVSLATTYNHLMSITKSSGRVSRGQLIGYEGTTGMSTGCHLHFEVLVNGEFVNPRSWL